MYLSNFEILLFPLFLIVRVILKQLLRTYIRTHSSLYDLFNSFYFRSSSPSQRFQTPTDPVLNM